MGNSVQLGRRFIFDNSTQFRNRKSFTGVKHQQTNRLIVAYFYSSFIAIMLQFVIQKEEKMVQLLYHRYKDTMEQEKMIIESKDLE